MKKSELKNGAVVVLRNGSEYLKVDDTLLYLRMDGYFMELDDYDEDLKYIGTYYGFNTIEIYDIVKVLNPVENKTYPKACNKALSIYENKTNIKWTWERKEDILTPSEREYLRAVIKPFRDKIVNIVFYNMHLAITTTNDNIQIKYKTLDMSFKQCERDKKYTLKELEL